MGTLNNDQHEAMAQAMAKVIIADNALAYEALRTKHYPTLQSMSLVQTLGYKKRVNELVNEAQNND